MRPAAHTCMPLRCVAIALVAVSLAYGSARAETITLKQEVYVKGPTVFLGEVADIQGENAPALSRIKLADAAVPGNSKRLDAALIESRIREAGIASDDLRLKGAHSIRATTLHLEITPEMVAEDLRLTVQNEMPWNPDNATIDIMIPQQDIRVPDGAVEFRWRPTSRYNFLGQGTYRGDLYVDGRRQKTLLCKVMVEAYGDVVVAANDIPRGKIIRPADLTVESQALSTAVRGAFRDPQDVVGFVARTTIFPGQVMAKRDVIPRRIIKRNQIVTVEAQHGPVRVQTRARAMDDAAEGDLLMCLNIESKETFHGVVRKDALVTVE